MKQEIILIGGGGHCKACIDIIEEENRYLIKGIIDLPEKIGQLISGYPIIDSDDNLQKYISENKKFLITKGFIKSPALRIKLFNSIKKFGGIFPVIVSPRSHISRFAKVEEGTIVMHGSIINAAAHVGKNCIINSRVLVEHDVAVSENAHISTGAILNGNCKVGKNCFIGSGSIVNQGITIGPDTIIGSGSLVRKNIVKSGLYAGNPLKKIK